MLAFTRSQITVTFHIAKSPLEINPYNRVEMPRPSKLTPKIPPPSKESFGKRLARIRKEKGFTQVELAEKLGTLQAIISDYERSKSRPHADTVTSIAIALDVSADELLGLSNLPKTAAPNRRILQRIQMIEKLPKRDQDALMRTIDAFLLKAS
jgi:transcriptional regulator with XRE-family HTH domain